MLLPGGRFALCTGTDFMSPVGKAFREILESRRPATLPDDVASLLEARKTIAGTSESKEMLRPEGWLRALEAAGFLSISVIEETHPVLFPDPDAYLRYSFAWGDNDRELHYMTKETRESLRMDFRRRVAALSSPKGLVVERPTRYFIAQK